jgi:hypothetical protein
MHEDLICKSSWKFRELLQKDRKTVEGKCSICHETLDADEDEITFCRTRCGQNSYERCMDQWKTAARGTAKCPIWHQVWKSGSNDTMEVMLDQESFDKDAMHVYCDWLYTGTIHIDDDLARDSEDLGMRILKAYGLACHLDDRDFQNAVVANYIAENRFAKRFWLTAINYVFVKLEEDEMDNGDDADFGIDEFVIDNFLEVMDPRFFKRHASTFPE